MTAIYALCEPDTGALRYIGKADKPEARFKGHLRECKRRNTPLYAWMRKLIANGLEPLLVILDEACADWKAREREFIARGRVHGHALLNLADGGDQPSSTPEQRRANGYRWAQIMRGAIPMKERKVTRAQLVIQILAGNLRRARINDDLFDQVAILFQMRERYLTDPKAYAVWKDV